MRINKKVSFFSTFSTSNIIVEYKVFGLLEFYLKFILQQFYERYLKIFRISFKETSERSVASGFCLHSELSREKFRRFSNVFSLPQDRFLKELGL